METKKGVCSICGLTVEGCTDYGDIEGFVILPSHTNEEGNFCVSSGSLGYAE